MVSGPLIPGMRRSMQGDVGVMVGEGGEAVGPSPASATTSMSGSASMMARRPTRTTG